MASQQDAPPPTPDGFFSQSAESFENKRVEFLQSAKMCKRVRKNVKRKDLNTVPRGGWHEWNSRISIVGIHLVVFARVATTGLPGCGKWKWAQGTELKGSVCAGLRRRFG
jgi:hypothetical protein